MSEKKSFLALKIITGIAGIGVLLLLVTNSIVTLGENIPKTNILFDYTVGAVHSIVLGFSILLWPVPSEDKLALIIIWAIKSIVTLGFMLFFEANYDSLDAYSYFDTPRQSIFEWTGFKITDGTENLYNLICLLYKVMPQSYHALKVTFAMVGLFGIYIFYCSTILFMQKKNIHFLYILALFPSILFWSSTIGKEPFMLLGIAFYAYGLVGWYRFKHFSYVCLIILGLIIATSIRSWLGIILLAPTIVFALQNMKASSYRLFTAGLLFIGLIFCLKSFLNIFAIQTSQDALVALNTWSRSWSTVGSSGQEVNADFTQLNQVIAFIPLGAFTALFRPLPGEVLNLFGLLAGLENLLLLYLMSLAIIRLRWKDFKNPVIVWATLVILTWVTVYGFISYQNLGAAVRFKCQILPILLSLLLYLGRRQQNVSEYQSSLIVNNENR